MSWALANDKNDALCAFVLGNKINLSFEEQRKYFSNNNAAREAFLERAEKGMNLSQRVWNYTAEYKNEIEAGLSLGLGKGKDAPALARELKRNLKAPDKLFRRVRDKYGILRLSKEAKNYHPGQGVYRSSYKNALRLAVTETNMAYRTADYQRYQQFDFIVGVEVHLSETNHPVTDICDHLQGRYPKDFKFVGWHPHCRCIATSILDLSSEPQQIKNTPQQFDKWVQDNAKRIKDADKRETTPYFVRDNRDAVDEILSKKKQDGNQQNSALNGKLINYNTINGSIGYNLNSSTSKNIEESSTKTNRKRTQEDAYQVETKWVDRQAKNSSLRSFIEECENVDDLTCRIPKILNKPLLEDEIINRVGGNDMTIGSCTSVAFAYLGNKANFDVLDFRGGESRNKFSSQTCIKAITKAVGGSIESNNNEFVAAWSILKNVEDNKEYFFMCGRHAAIVRKNAEGNLEYLELQSNANGWYNLNKDSLANRFMAVKSKKIIGIEIDSDVILIDANLLYNNKGFRKVLGFINTATENQNKK